MQGRGAKFWILWGLTLLSFSAGCTANRRLTYCIAGSVIGAGVGAGIHPALREYADVPMGVTVGFTAVVFAMGSLLRKIRDT